MPILKRDGQESSESTTIYRYIEATDGEMTIESIFAPRFDYAREETSLEITDGAVTVTATAKGGHEPPVLRVNHGCWIIQDNVAKAVWKLQKGDRFWLCLQRGS